MRKVTSKKDDYTVECKSQSETADVLNYINNDNDRDWEHWKYVSKYDGLNNEINDSIPERLNHLPVISFEEWCLLPEYDPKEVSFKDFVLPEKWGIIGCEELKTYFKENEINTLDGGYYNQYYFINSDDEWDCGSIEWKDDKTQIITFEQFKEHVLSEKPKERKIVGYKLAKEEYKEAIAKLISPNVVDFDYTDNCLFTKESNMKKDMENYNLLYVLFEPVYEESIETKIVDYLAEQGIEINEEFASEIIKIVNEK